MEAKDVDNKIMAVLVEHLGTPVKAKPVHRDLYKAGIREVVEWIHQYQCADEDCVKWQCFERDEWQAQLKVWGIDNAE